MSLIKEIDKELGACKVTFIIPAEISKRFHRISLAGDFNFWNVNMDQFSNTKSDGSKFISLELPLHNEYKFKYFCGGNTWLNEPDADEFVPVPFEDSYYSLIVV